MMSLLTLPALFPIGKDVASEPEEMSAAEFRVAYRAEIKRLQMRIFFDELQEISGQKTIKSLLDYLGVDAEDENQISAWYARARGQYIPRSPQAASLRKKLAAAKFELHHPVWRWLAAPNIDLRTVRRLKAQMPGYWHETATLLGTLPDSKVVVGAELMDHLGLHRLTYLDALFLFWVERQYATSRSSEQRRTNLNQIIWLLPVLYPDDPIWAQPHKERQRLTLALFDYSLGFRGADDPLLYWGWTDRISLILEQQWRRMEYLRSHPQGLRTMLSRRRYLAIMWRWRNSV